MIKLVILDFDGTLADTRVLIVRTNQEVMRRMNYPVADEASIVATIGLPLKECIPALFPGISSEAIPGCVLLYREVFESLKTTITPVLFPGVRETLETLHDSGIMLSVASSRGSESLNAFLREMGIDRYINYVLGAEDVTHAKPHPEPVLKTLKGLSVAAPEALVVGDMPVDIQMGLGAGAKTCGVTYGNSNRAALAQAGAHHIIDSFSELSACTIRALTSMTIK